MDSGFNTKSGTWISKNTAAMPRAMPMIGGDASFFNPARALPSLAASDFPSFLRSQIPTVQNSSVLAI